MTNLGYNDKIKTRFLDLQPCSPPTSFDDTNFLVTVRLEQDKEYLMLVENYEDFLYASHHYSQQWYYLGPANQLFNP